MEARMSANKTAMIERERIGKVLSGLAGYLADERDAGVSHLEISAGTMAGLKGRGSSDPVRGSPVRSSPSPVVAPPVRKAAVKPAPVKPEPVIQTVDAGTLDEIAAMAAACKVCNLHKTRTKSVPGQGNARPELMFIGEAPGYEEDINGLAFIGAAGQLLTKMIVAMNMTRDDVFIANIAKCRPPANRTPLPDEMAACLPFLKAQIKLLKPRVIVVLGATATKGLLGEAVGITKIRGKWKTFEGIDVMPTFHPAYLLRVPSAKKDAWADLKEVLRKLGKPVPNR